MVAAAPALAAHPADGGLGYTGFNRLLYAAGTCTGTVNLALFQGSIPVLVILLNRFVHRMPVGGGQAAGVVLTLVGAGLAATRGDGSVPARLDFNRGGVLVFGACLLYAGYTIFLPSRPKVSGLAFFAAMSVAAFLTSLPPLAVEWAAGHAVWPSGSGRAKVAFVGLGPSLLAQPFVMRGVELIGPNRAGLFVTSCRSSARSSPSCWSASRSGRSKGPPWRSFSAASPAPGA